MIKYNYLTVVQAEELIRYAQSSFDIDFVPKSLMFPCKIAPKSVIDHVDNPQGVEFHRGWSYDEWIHYDGGSKQ